MWLWVDITVELHVDNDKQFNFNSKYPTESLSWHCWRLPLDIAHPYNWILAPNPTYVIWLHLGYKRGFKLEITIQPQLDTAIRITILHLIRLLLDTLIYTNFALLINSNVTLPVAPFWRCYIFSLAIAVLLQLAIVLEYSSWILPYDSKFLLQP